jgi:hypothetical protein
MIAQVTSGHENVRTMAARLKEMLGSDTPPEMQALASARWALASALMQLLATKERHIYTKLEQHARPEVRQYFERSKADLKRWFDTYTAHVEKWPTSDTRNDWAGYRKSALNVVELFLTRLKTEELDLFPYVEKIGLDVSRPCLAISNWTRQAFQVKDSIGR